jgi:hypothetical protein
MFDKIKSVIWTGLGIIAALTWISVLVGLAIHLIRFAWSAF